MSVTKDGKNNNGSQNWKLCVPDKHCKAGLEVTITETKDGLSIGDGFIPYNEIRKFKEIRELLRDILKDITADNMLSPDVFDRLVSEVKRYE